MTVKNENDLRRCDIDLRTHNAIAAQAETIQPARVRETTGI